jgi:multidrug efflux pump subunit AcrB
MRFTQGLAFHRNVTPGTVPLAVNLLGQLPAITISFSLTKGYALSDAVMAIHRTRDRISMPDTVLGQFQGQAFQSSMGNMGLLLIIAIITVCIILSILN